jgi:hypothetical protein
MGILAMKVLVLWSLVATIASYVLGAVIRRGERVHKDEFLTAIFATLSSQQASR